MTQASVKPALKRIENDIAEIKELIQNENSEPSQKETEQNTEEADCLCDETKQELESE